MESSNFQTTSSVNDDNYIQESVAFSIDSNKEPSFLQMLTAQKSSPSICSSSTAGRKKSPVWGNFEQEGRFKAKCKKCGMVVQARANQDMKSHLLKCKYNKNNKIATGEEFFDLCKLRSLDSKKVQVELVEAILSCGCCINILSNPKFREFLVNNIPKFKIPNVHSVRNVIIPELAHGVRAIIGKNCWKAR